MLHSNLAADEKTLRPLYGRPVCVVLEDDTRYTGILTSCSSSSLTLNGERTLRPVKRKRKARIQAKETTVQEETPNSEAYWGTLSIEPPMPPIHFARKVIPLAPVKNVIVL